MGHIWVLNFVLNYEIITNFKIIISQERQVCELCKYLYLYTEKANAKFLTSGWHINTNSTWES